MIEKAANYIALGIKKANPEKTANIEVLSFALIMVLGTGSTLFLALSISSILGTLFDTVLTLFSFAFLRAFAGGFHFKTAELCTITSATGALIIPLININNEVIMFLTVFSSIVMLALAPCGINQSRVFKQAHYPLLKIISICIVLLNFVINSSVLSLTFSAQALTMIVYKLRERR